MLQQCPLIHWKRMARHDHPAKVFGRAAAAMGWTAEEEPHIREESGLLKKPDLMLRRDRELIVTNIAVA